MPGADGERHAQRAGGVSSATACSRPGSIRPPGTRRSPTGCCSRRASSRADGSWPTYRQPEVTLDDVSDLRAVDRHALQLGHADLRPALLHDAGSCRVSASASRRRMSPAATRSRPGSSSRKPTCEQASKAGTNNVDYMFNNGVPVSLNAVGDAVRTEARENKDFGFFVAGSVDAAAPDAHLRPALRVLQRLRAAADVPATPNGWVPDAELRRGQERAALEGLRSALRRGVRPLRRRPDGAEGGAGPIRVEVGDSTITAGQQPDPDVDQLGQPHLERRSGRRSAPRQLHPGLRPGEPRRQRRVRRHGEPELRRAQRRRRAMPTTRSTATARAATTGTSPPKCSTSSGPACR